MNREQFTGWRKSTRSGNDKDCVEVGRSTGVVGVADTKQHGLGPILEFGMPEWAQFLASVKSGDHELY